MTPAAATAAARSRARTPAPGAPRRVSGPARRAPGGAPGAVAAPLGLRLARRAAALPDARVIDRLARGRVWIGLLGLLLVGIVFLQISQLKLTTGISRAVQTEQTLERQNTQLKLDLSRLGGGDRVQDSAAARGFVLPVTGQPRFLDASRSSAARAAANVTPPDPVAQLPLGMISPTLGGTAGVTPDPVAPAGAAGTAATAIPAGSATTPQVATATPPTATTPQASTSAPVQSAPVTPSTTPAPAVTAPTPAAPASTPAASTPSAPTAGGAAAAPQG